MTTIPTVVLDDDPTGTQAARDVRVLWETDADSLRAALAADAAVFVQTNSRALGEDAAVRLIESVRQDAATAVAGPIRFVLRGDSTLRGHVFPEIGVFTRAAPDAVVIFVPAFPAGGRTTRGGTHYVRVGDRDVPAGDTEYARDPVFGFRSSDLTAYVAEFSDRAAYAVALDDVRRGGVAAAIRAAGPGAVVTPDAVTDDDIVAIAAGIGDAERDGIPVLVRCAAPLAAELAGVRAQGLLDEVDGNGPLLVVCGSHTDGARRQLDALDPSRERVEVDTTAALEDPVAEGGRVAEAARPLLAAGRVIITSARDRSPTHNTLWHGGQVAAALTEAVRMLRTDAGPLLVKGGITSAETARAGLGAAGAWVRGQLLPGVAVWDVVDAEGRPHPYVIVPGNVGDDDVLQTLARRIVGSKTEPEPVTG